MKYLSLPLLLASAYIVPAIALDIVNASPQVSDVQPSATSNEKDANVEIHPTLRMLDDTQPSYCRNSCKATMVLPSGANNGGQYSSSPTFEYDLLQLCDQSGWGYRSTIEGKPAAINVCGSLRQKCPSSGGMFCMAGGIGQGTGVCALDPDSLSSGSVISTNYTESCTGAAMPCQKCVVYSPAADDAYPDKFAFIDPTNPALGIKIIKQGVPLSQTEKAHAVESCSGNGATGRYVSIHIQCDCNQKVPIALFAGFYNFDERYDCNVTAVFRSSLGCWSGYCSTNQGSSGTTSKPGYGSSTQSSYGNESPSFISVLIWGLIVYIVLAMSFNYYREGSCSLPKSHQDFFSRVGSYIKEIVSRVCFICHNRMEEHRRQTHIHQYQPVSQNKQSTGANQASSLSTTDEL